MSESAVEQSAHAALHTTDPSLILREQFATPDQQRQTATIGMWIFLMSEVLLFGGLFTAFTAYRISHPHAFDLGSKDMEIILGSINTAVLICSSYTMALAVHSAEVGNQKRLALFLFATMVIGAIFLAIKFTEYYLHYQDHKAPGYWFIEHAPGAPQIQMFFVLLHHDGAACGSYDDRHRNPCSVALSFSTRQIFS